MRLPWPVMALVAVLAAIFAAYRLTGPWDGSADSIPPLPPRPPVVAIEQADIYLDVIAPALHAHCAECHNPRKRKGELVMTTYAELLAGTDRGPVIQPGAPERSDLMRRVQLDPDDTDFMPTDGKPPLTQAQIALLGWWIAIGAPEQGLLATLNPPADVRQAVASELKLPLQ